MAMVLALRTLGATLFFDTGPKAEGVLPALLATLERVLPQARWVRGRCAPQPGRVGNDGAEVADTGGGCRATAHRTCPS